MTEFRSGFVCLVGRPNAGKSTLTNALVGAKVAITSNRPQTTRHTIRGIVHRDGFQIILVDTPGLHRPRTLLGKRLNDLVRDTYSEVDVIGLCIPADEPIGPGDRWIYHQIRDVAPRTTLIVIVTKADKVARDRVAAQLVAVSAEFGEHAKEIVPVAVRSADGAAEGEGEPHAVDEGIRFNATLEAIAGVKLIQEGGRCTAATASHLVQAPAATASLALFTRAGSMINARRARRQSVSGIRLSLVESSPADVCSMCRMLVSPKSAAFAGFGTVSASAACP